MSQAQNTLTALLPDLNEVPEAFRQESLILAFTTWTESQGINLYRAQEEAALALATGDNVILSTPTGSGKSMVAMAAHFIALSQGQRSFYTAPIKALVSEKFFQLCAVFGPENVGMMTGDATVNSDAPIICATAEILANIALREGSQASIDQVVMDEFHFYSDSERGWAWQVPLLELPQAQFLLMSATLGDTTFLEEDLTARNHRTTTVISGTQRPVPLDFEYSYAPLEQAIETSLTEKPGPVYVVHFSQRGAIEDAVSLSKNTYVTAEEKTIIAEEIGDFKFTTKFGKQLSSLLRKGIGVHHAGMLPKYRRLVERLAQKGLLRVISGTDTLGVGINVPIRTVLFTGLAKYDGTKQRTLQSREFHQIAGRAGRAGFDTQGSVIVQAPEFEIENSLARKRAGQDEKKIKKLRKRSAPEGQIVWSEKTYERLINAEPEALTSRFSVDTALLLNLAGREENFFDTFYHLVRKSHDTRTAQNASLRLGIELYRGLTNSGVVTENIDPTTGIKDVHLAQEMPLDFALNQPLAPFALAALDLLDPDSESYTLDIISVMEAIVEDPRPLLQAQQRSARAEEIAQLKVDGVPYDERKALVEEITWPQPLSEVLEPALDEYRAGNPWTRDFYLSPKSVLRTMVEQAMTFNDLISVYGIERSEGVVLHYLMQLWKVLDQTIPESLKTDELQEIIEWLKVTITQVDNSLLEEWTLLNNPDAVLDNEQLAQRAYGAAKTQGISANSQVFRRMIQNLLFRHIELFAFEKEKELEGMDKYLEVPPQWPELMDEYFDEYADVGIGASARAKDMVVITPGADTWEAVHILEDPAGDNAWRLHALVDVPASDAAGEVVLQSLRMEHM